MYLSTVVPFLNHFATGCFYGVFVKKKKKKSKVSGTQLLFLSLSVFITILPLYLSLASTSPDWSGNCVFSQTHTADVHRCLAKQWSCARVISEVFTLRRPKRPHGEESLPLSNWISLQEERERGIKRKREREGGSECESVYHSSPSLDPTSRWAGNEAEDTH